ncbi:MAG: T9SS type A sorting domain-containing protein [Bacteroidetes bacterium]|nr:T9SS type A sorting domain-containing protein [Bacteroidota bacterium]
MNTIGVPQYLDSYKIYPNPTSNGQISIALHLIRANNVRMSLNDVTGRECRILYNSKMETGDHTIKCQLPNAIPGMLYFLKVQIGNHVSVEKLLITD